jgi:hypothetical protein
MTSVTKRECQAMDAHLSAITLECQRAGYGSLDGSKLHSAVGRAEPAIATDNG